MATRRFPTRSGCVFGPKGACSPRALPGTDQRPCPAPDQRPRLLCGAGHGTECLLGLGWTLRRQFGPLPSPPKASKRSIVDDTSGNPTLAVATRGIADIRLAGISGSRTIVVDIGFRHGIGSRCAPADQVKPMPMTAVYRSSKLRISTRVDGVVVRAESSPATVRSGYSPCRCLLRRDIACNQLLGGDSCRRAIFCRGGARWSLSRRGLGSGSDRPSWRRCLDIGLKTSE